MKHYYKDLEGWWGDADAALYAKMVDRFNSGSHFVEIGSFKGRSSSCMAVEIINSSKDIRFDCVDTWLGSEEHQENNNCEDGDVVSGEMFNVFLKNIKNVSHVINPIGLPSEEASKLYEDDSIDFVFIDGAHDIHNVLKDVCNWSPKVKTGGVIAGHDYGGGHIGVKIAVDLFFKQQTKGAEVQTFKDCSWWIVEKNFQIPTENTFDNLVAWATALFNDEYLRHINYKKKEKKKNKNHISWSRDTNGKMVRHD
tara:strand:+ start:168 stop:926 length:759 start_codon:yes stop_codon:yes gene_type:complete